MPYLENADAKIYFETWGDAGEWVTLLNGYSRTLNDFRGLARHLVAEGFRVVSLDNRGCGRTESGPFSMSDSIADVGRLWDHIGVDRSHVFGTSYGGALGLGVALTFPTRVNRLMLVSSSPSSPAVKRLTLTKPEEFMRYFSRRFARDYSVLARSLAKEMSAVFNDPAGLKATEAQRAALKDYNFIPRLSEVRCPTLILHGEEDNIVDPAAAETLGTGIANARVERVPEVGHLFLAEAPRRLYALAGRFFRNEGTSSF